MEKPFGFSDAVASDSIKKELTRFFYCLRIKWQNIGAVDRDIPKIIKFKATTSLRISCLFCIFKHSVRQEVV